MQAKHSYTKIKVFKKKMKKPFKVCIHKIIGSSPSAVQKGERSREKRRGKGKRGAGRRETATRHSWKEWLLRKKVNSKHHIKPPGCHPTGCPELGLPQRTAALRRTLDCWSGVKSANPTVTSVSSAEAFPRES